MLLRQTQTEKLFWLFRETVNEIFKVSLISYLIGYLVENFKAGFISDYFNLNILFWGAILSGVLVVWIKADEPDEEKNQHKVPAHYYLFVFLLGLCAAAFIYYKIRAIGWFAYLIALLTGATIVFLSILLLTEKGEKVLDEESSKKNFFSRITDKFKTE